MDGTDSNAGAQGISEEQKVYSPPERGKTIMTDPVEQTEQYRKIEKKLEKKIIKRVGKGGYMGYCYRYWSAKKAILKEDYGIDWKSPAELNPWTRFD